MSKSTNEDEANVDEAKLDSLLKRMLQTPPKPHDEKKVRKPDAKPRSDRRPAPR